MTDASNIKAMTTTIERRTSADEVFDILYDEIVSLRLLPGTKMSEADVASRFGVSRQPVRDAFSRLENLDFLLIVPQRATEVRKISRIKIDRARFLRAAIEVEVAGQAITHWTPEHAASFEENLVLQDIAVRNNDVDAFHRLDYDFHRQMCDAGNVAFAFDAIMENKAHIDRLCVLSMMDNDAMAQLVDDHRLIYASLRKKDADSLDKAIRTHLSRLDATIEHVAAEHPEYFI